MNSQQLCEFLAWESVNFRASYNTSVPSIFFLSFFFFFFFFSHFTYSKSCHFPPPPPPRELSRIRLLLADRRLRIFYLQGEQQTTKKPDSSFFFFSLPFRGHRSRHQPFARRGELDGRIPRTGCHSSCNCPPQNDRPLSPWANPEKSLRKGSLVPRAGTKVSLHKCED